MGQYSTGRLSIAWIALRELQIASTYCVDIAASQRCKLAAYDNRLGVILM